MFNTTRCVFATTARIFKTISIFLKLTQTTLLHAQFIKVKTSQKKYSKSTDFQSNYSSEKNSLIYTTIEE